MNLPQKLRTIQATLYRLNLKYARIRMLERKQDTRQKIQLGGLIKKAGLHEEPTAVLLGLLLEAKENLEGTSGNKIREGYRLKGDIVFTSERSGAGKDHP